ncbi:MAG TPA: 2-dehydropantoate 2-reductase [Bacteroidia bacterium]
MNKTKKIGVVGMGPVGQILAVHLKEAGFDLSVCDKDKEKMNLIRKDGVRLEGRIQKHHYFSNAHTSIEELLEHNVDLLIFSVKSHHMASTLHDMERLQLSDKMCVLSAQNGIDVEKKLSDVFGEARTLRMVINFAGNLHAPNAVNVTFFNPPNYIASIDDSKQDLAKEVAIMLSGVALETHCISSFRMTDQIWEKTILNASMSPLCGISRLTMKEAMDFPDTVDIAEQLILEAVEVAKAEEIKFPENFVKLCLRYLKQAGNHFPSMAVDMINNRETEIDFFNGKIVEYGKKHYIRTPLNLTLTNLVKAASYKNALIRTNTKTESETTLDV